MITAAHRIKELKDRINTFRRSETARKLGRWTRRLVVFAILAVIGWNLWSLGWGEVLRSLPMHPGYYLIFVLLYFSLPVAEVLIYRQIWQFPTASGFRVFLNKRVYNNEVIGYSGEFYLYLWAKRKLGLPGEQVMKAVRDSNILSALVSYLVALTLVGILVFGGVVDLEVWFGEIDRLLAAAAGVVSVILVVVLIQFRRHLFSLPRMIALRIFGIYVFRFVFHHAGLAVMWMLVMPGAPLTVWMTFIAMYVVINRLPFFPSKDLVFALAGIEMAGIVGINPAEVAGMLLVYSALNKIVNMILFSVLSLKKEKESLTETT